MSDRFDLLTQQLFQKNISDCSVEELQSLAEQYPYFAPAQYALLKKLEQTDSNSYPEQLQKTILYYHNPAGFNHFINEDFASIEFVETETAPAPETISTTEEFAGTEEETVPAQDSEEMEEAEEMRIQDEPELVVSMPTDMKEPIPSVEEIKAPPETNGIADEVLTFEPYHTVDYFASQGIKLSQEEATKDRFGRQLKSFTEWLKTMKKLPATEQAKPMDVVAEQKVENLAAHSVEESDVVTEAMAEVWVKQGKTEKAIDVYNKLSLLNPSKRAYFAAKVEFLKKEI
jgi:hypothetical protein